MRVLVVGTKRCGAGVNRDQDRGDEPCRKAAGLLATGMAGWLVVLLLVPGALRQGQQILSSGLDGEL